MKNSIHMFTGIQSGLKVPFNLDNFTGALPIGKTGNEGTILYGNGLPEAGISVVESVHAVTEAVTPWFAAKAQLLNGQA